MRVFSSFDEFDECDLTTEEIKEAIGHAQASLEEYSRLGELDQARAAYEARDNLLLALAERLKVEALA